MTIPAFARRTPLMLALVLTAAMPAARAQNGAPAPEGCGQPYNLYGPFDYRLASSQQKHMVEHAHFTRGVETLTKGATGPFGKDIAYTLAVFPNHPRAIQTVEKLAEREKKDPPYGTDMTVECYYARGMNYAPNDLVFRMFYVSYLTRRNRLDEARRFLDYVVEKAGDNPLSHFNAGLLYFDMKDYDKALVQAHRAMALGWQHPDLRNRLNSVGRWKDPDPAQAAGAAASAPQAASAASETSR
jgi:tetratricopeptide (TPR) repeat protein